jgi:hypothetical protein
VHCLPFITKDLTGPSSVFPFPLQNFLHVDTFLPQNMRRNRISKLLVSNTLFILFLCLICSSEAEDVFRSKLNSFSFLILLLVLSTGTTAGVPSKRTWGTVLSPHQCVKQRTVFGVDHVIGEHVFISVSASAHLHGSHVPGHDWRGYCFKFCIQPRESESVIERAVRENEIQWEYNLPVDYKFKLLDILSQRKCQAPSVIN